MGWFSDDNEGGLLGGAGDFGSGSGSGERGGNSLGASDPSDDSDKRSPESEPTTIRVVIKDNGKLYAKQNGKYVDANGKPVSTDQANNLKGKQHAATLYGGSKRGRISDPENYTRSFERQPAPSQRERKGCLRDS